MKPIHFLPLLFLLTIQCRPKDDNNITQFPGKPVVPASIRAEHKLLLEKIHELTTLKDSAGPRAIKLEELMRHHFEEEEDYVLPQLGILLLLANGELPQQGNETIQLSEKLRSQLPHLSAEHQFIKALIDELLQAALKEDRPAIIEFEKELQKHASMEEEILFPASILIGEYLKLKSTGTSK